MAAAADAPALADAAAFTRRYYGERAARFGATPAGVDWTCVATQQMRFVQLLRVVDRSAPFTLSDLGCGYGALLDFLDADAPAAAAGYRGVDLAAEMIGMAQRRHPGRADRFRVADRADPADYTVASGVFNVRSPADLPDWEAAVAATLDQVAATSRRGYAVNFLHRDRVPDARTGLYATVPERWAGHCRRPGATVEIVDGYGLPEFTVLVRPSSSDSARSNNG